jgi:mannitol/fructose-specific phosphotransferase system IIA component (Ntr-type)
VVFLLLSPAEEPAAHLASLAEVARLVADRARIHAIAEAESAEAMVRALVLQPGADSTA